MAGATEAQISAVNAHFYGLSSNEFAFFSAQTGITEEEALKTHIISVAAKAFDIFKYICIRDFAFLRLNMSSLPAYQHLLHVGREHKEAILLDIGCCFGVDVRKAISDGFPAQNIIASDLRPEFWELGHALFLSTPSSFPVAFAPGDAFDDSFIGLHGASLVDGIGDKSLKVVKALSTLEGRISVIHASKFFHLFIEDKQVELCQRLAKLLSPSPGSMIFGQHRGSDVAGDIVNGIRGETVFCHSPDSWEKLWNGVVFPEGTVRVDCVLQPGKWHLGEFVPARMLQWSVIRI